MKNWNRVSGNRVSDGVLPNTNKNIKMGNIKIKDKRIELKNIKKKYENKNIKIKKKR